MHGYNNFMVKEQIYYPRYIYMVECSQHYRYKLLSTHLIFNYACCQGLLTIMFTQTNSCIGRLQVEQVDIPISKN